MTDSVAKSKVLSTKINAENEIFSRPMIKIYFKILLSAWKNFGIGVVFFRWLFVIPTFLVFTRITFFLDRIFFPQYCKIQVKKPIFIIGNPRSGTTFLHHFLIEKGNFIGFEAWHLFFPALTARYLFSPFINYLLKKNRSVIVPDEIGHGVFLDKLEEEELLLLHKLDTQFVFQLSPLAFDDLEYPELRFYDQQPESRRLSSVRFFKSCLQRQIYYTGKEQIVAQMHFSTHRIKTLLQIFPDAKFIYLIRSPHETIPSHLSLTRNLFKHRWKLKNIPLEKLNRYFQRRYRYDLDIYRYFYELKKNQEITENQVMILEYDLLKSELEKALEKILAFTEVKNSDKLRSAAKLQVKSQKQYKRKHKVMDLEEFGLSKKQITEALPFVFQEYDFDKKTKSSDSKNQVQENSHGKHLNQKLLYRQIRHLQ